MKTFTKVPHDFATLNSQSETSNILFAQRIVDKAHTVPTHWHVFFEFELIIEGSATHIINNETYELQPGSAYIMTLCDYHSITPHSNLKILNLSFTYGYLDGELEDLLYNHVGGFHCSFDGEMLNSVCDVFKKGINIDISTPHCEILLKCFAQELIIYMLKTQSKLYLMPLLRSYNR